MNDPDIRTVLDRLARLEGRIDNFADRLARLEGSSSTVKLILSYVVTPLLILLGGLIGVKLII